MAIIGSLHFTVHFPDYPFGCNRILYAISDAVTVGETEFAAQGNTTVLWDEPAFVTIKSVDLESDLVFQMYQDSTDFDNSLGYVRVPVVDLIKSDAPGDGISYPVASGLVKGRNLIISHRFTDFRREIDKRVIVKDEIAPAEEIPKKKYGFAKRVAERVGAGAIVSCFVASCATPEE